MSDAVVFTSNQDSASELRFCTTEQLAALFGFTPHWIYKLNKRGKGLRD